MLCFKEDKKPETLASISDEDLTSKITTLMWRASKARNKNLAVPTIMSELEQCYQETQQRQKIHLWHRAKDCFNANQFRPLEVRET